MVSLILLAACISVFYAGFFPVKVVVPGEASYATLDPHVDLTKDGTAHVRFRGLNRLWNCEKRP